MEYTGEIPDTVQSKADEMELQLKTALKEQLLMQINREKEVSRMINAFLGVPDEEVSHV